MIEHEHNPKELEKYATVEEVNGHAVWTCLVCKQIVLTIKM